MTGKYPKQIYRLREHTIQDRIRLAISPYAIVFRANVGKVKTPDGRFFDTGLPVGFSDLFGFRKSDGKMFFIEVKTPSGRISDAQRNFINQMQNFGAIAGVCRSEEDALVLLELIN